MTTYFSRKSITVASMIVLVILLAGCNLPTSPATLPPILTPTSTIQPQNSPEALSPTPTFTPTETITATPSEGIITFAPGTTAWVVEGSLQSGQTKSFTVDAQKNQTMILILESTNNDLSLGVFEKNGTALLSPANKWNQWQWILPATDTYTIQAIGGSTTENYKLTVKIAAQIEFPAGGTSTTIHASTVNGYVLTYALVCHGTQNMSVSLNTPASSAYLDVFGITGDIMLNKSLQATSWSGSLPSTQTYLIEVIPATGQVVDFTLTISVN